MTQKFIELSKNNKNLKTQTIINIACFGKILILPLKYNAMVSILKDFNPLLKYLFKEEDIIEANDSPYIINYSEKKKTLE